MVEGEKEREKEKETEMKSLRHTHTNTHTHTHTHLPARPFLCLALARLTHSAAMVLMLFWVSKCVSLIFPPSITYTTSSIVMLEGGREWQGAGHKGTHFSGG